MTTEEATKKDLGRALFCCILTGIPEISMFVIAFRQGGFLAAIVYMFTVMLFLTVIFLIALFCTIYLAKKYIDIRAGRYHRPKESINKKALNEGIVNDPHLERPETCPLCGSPVEDLIRERCSGCGAAWCTYCGLWNDARQSFCKACRRFLPEKYRPGELPSAYPTSCLSCQRSIMGPGIQPFICDTCFSTLSNEDQARVQRLQKRFKISKIFFLISFITCLVLWFFVPVLMVTLPPVAPLFMIVIMIFLCTLPVHGTFMGLGPMIGVKRDLIRAILRGLGTSEEKRGNLAHPRVRLTSEVDMAPTVTSCWRCGAPMQSTICPACFAWTCPSCQTNNETTMDRCMFCDAPRPKEA
ncbi:MAG: formate dehydrogenase accessory protein FdhE [Candidatus Lokiarchaeota archaeon]|nr:formate dehydrogenase accessory protein FdhE [Candidatus Lokiarchaeota archaeon]